MVWPQAAFLCRAEQLVCSGKSVEQAFGLVKPRELTPIALDDDDAFADAWAVSGDHLGHLLKNAMDMEELEATKAAQKPTAKSIDI